MKRSPLFKLRLYVVGTTSNSTEAIANLKLLCRTHLAGRHELEIIDVQRHPRRGLADRILITPMLVKSAPGLECRMVGTLSETDKVLRALGLEPAAA
jgi:circadian clock protein KaiB